MVHIGHDNAVIRFSIQHDDCLSLSGLYRCLRQQLWIHHIEITTCAQQRIHHRRQRVFLLLLFLSDKYPGRGRGIHQQCAHMALESSQHLAESIRVTAQQFLLLPPGHLAER